MQNAKLIIGLGNPGKQYENTRHNMGFLVVRELARMHGATLQSKPQLLGEFAKANVGGQTLIFLLPMTYMNLSGRSVQRCVDFYKLDVSNLFVIVDDIYIPFGKMRLREKGQSGGHNGLKNIDEHLGTENYTRLRVGIGGSQTEELSDFVVGKFKKDEVEKLPGVIDSAMEITNAWINSGIKEALETLSRVFQGKSEKKSNLSEDSKHS